MRLRLAVSCLLTSALLAATVAAKSPIAEGYEAVDLTHTLDDKFPYIPIPGLTFPFALQPIATLKKNGVAANRWQIHEHLGTQIDAPNHFVEGGAGLDALNAKDIIVPTVVIDYREQSADDADAELTIDQIRQWEMRHGRVPAGAVVMLYTGWDTRIGDSRAYINADDKHVKHFPGFGEAAARFLVDERNVWGVGVDTVSFDPGHDDNYRTHKVVLGAGKWALEAVANLQQVPAVGATLFVGAPKVRNATGGPVRLLALRPIVTPLDADRLSGSWRSPVPERVARADGVTVYVAKHFSFDGDQWQIRFDVSADENGKTRLFSGGFGGPYQLGAYQPLVDAYQGRFLFSRRKLTVYSPQLLSTVETGGCGVGAWQEGVAKDVLTTGCAPLNVKPARDCEGEYDLVNVKGENLYFGKRPADGNLCSADRRPQRLTAVPVRKVER